MSDKVDQWNKDTDNLDLDGLKGKFGDLAYDGDIDHATWCNALRYIDGEYELRNHTLCRNAFKRCLSKLGK